MFYGNIHIDSLEPKYYVMFKFFLQISISNVTQCSIHDVYQLKELKIEFQYQQIISSPNRNF